MMYENQYLFLCTGRTKKEQTYYRYNKPNKRQSIQTRTTCQAYIFPFIYHPATTHVETHDANQKNIKNDSDYGKHIRVQPQNHSLKKCSLSQTNN